MNCPFCEAAVADDASRCGACKADIQVKCASCGKLTTIIDPKCAQCGAQRPIPQPKPEEIPPDPAQPRFSFVSVVLKAVATILALLCIFTGIGGQLGEAISAGVAAAVFGALATILDTVLITDARVERLEREIRPPRFPKGK